MSEGDACLVLFVCSRSWLPTPHMETDLLIDTSMAESSMSEIDIDAPTSGVANIDAPRRRVANGLAETASTDEDLIDINTDSQFDYPDIADKSHGM